MHGDAGPPGCFTAYPAGDVPLSILHAPADGESFLAYVRGCQVSSVDARRVPLGACDAAVMRGHAGMSKVKSPRSAAFWPDVGRRQGTAQNC